VIARLRSAGFARAVLLYLAVFCAVGAWLPWTGATPRPAPPWAVATGLDRPFSSLPFLAGVAALFASTLACTWGRLGRIVALARGARPAAAVELVGPADEVAAFLRARGFRGAGRLRRRFTAALFGGWVLHVGLLVLIAGALVQQAFHEGGNFVLTEGERADLAAPLVVFGRERGPLAPASPPDLSVALDAFDPFLLETGYAPDRHSTLLVERRGEPPREVELDRVRGVRIGGVTIYQAIPTGLSLVIDVEGAGLRTVHMQPVGPTRSTGDAIAPDGVRVPFDLRSERPLGFRAGTGRLEATVGADRRPIAEGESFDFGPGRARLVRFARWGGFSYDRSPGKPAAWAGFAAVLLGCALLVFPAGVAVVPSSPDDPPAWVFVARGGELLEAEWSARTDAPPPPGT
jgi:hypothetical protein